MSATKERKLTPKQEEIRITLIEMKTLEESAFAINNHIYHIEAKPESKKIVVEAACDIGVALGALMKKVEKLLL